MYIGLKHAHAFIADLSLLLLVIATFTAIYGFVRQRQFTKKDKIISLLALVGVHIQMVVGFLLYFTSPLGASNLSGDTMKNSIGRFYALEHPLIMLTAIVLITIGYSTAKRAKEDKQKFKKIAILYSIGLALILTRLPWHIWLA